jgi:hypothetical protein
MNEATRGSALERFKRQASGPVPELVVSDTEAGEQIEERRAYSVVRGRRGQVLMLELRFMNGNRLALGYPYLVAVEFDLSGIITLQFSGRVVTVEGVNLGPVYMALLNHSVGYLQEQDAERDVMQEGEPFIEAIRADAIEE